MAKKVSEVKLIYSVYEVAEILGISRRTAYQLANDPQGLPVVKVGKRILIPREALLRWLDERAS